GLEPGESLRFSLRVDRTPTVRQQLKSDDEAVSDSCALEVSSIAAVLGNWSAPRSTAHRRDSPSRISVRAGSLVKHDEIDAKSGELTNDGDELVRLRASRWCLTTTTASSRGRAAIPAPLTRLLSALYRAAGREWRWRSRPLLPS